MRAIKNASQMELDMFLFEFTSKPHWMDEE